MVNKDVEIYVSLQAKLLIDQMPEFNLVDMKDWFVNIKKISIGGGDVIDYLVWKVKGDKA